MTLRPATAWPWAALVAGLVLAALPGDGTGVALASAAGQVLLLAGAGTLLGRAGLHPGHAGAALLGTVLALLLTPVGRIQALDPGSTAKLGLSLAVPGLLALVVAGAFAQDWRERRPFRRERRRRGRALEGFFLLLAVLGLASGGWPLLLPALVRPQLRWLRGGGMRSHLVWSTVLLTVLLVGIWFTELNSTLQRSFALDSAGMVDASLSVGEGGRPLAVFAAVATAWMALLPPLGMLVIVGRLLRQSRIRTKLALNALLSGVLPLLLIALLFGTVAVVVLGSYRARLVRAQFDERMESCRLVTAWFAQAWSDPLDRAAQRRFEQQIRSLGDESHLSRAFFSLYWPAEGETPRIGLRQAATAAAPDSTAPPERWERLVSTWRMPSDFPLEEISLPADWRSRESIGLLRVGSRALHVALVETEGLLAIGFFPLDQEALEQIGRTLGTGIAVVSVPDEENRIRFGLNRLGLDLPCRSVELSRTSDFPGPDAPLGERLFRVGLSRLDQPDFAMDAAEEQLIVLVEALPARILPAVFDDEDTIVFPYVLLLILQLLVLLPLLVAAVWTAWMLNWRITRSIGELRDGTERLAAGDLDARIPQQTGDELGLLAASFNGMSARIRDNIAALAEKERLERELGIAREIQQGLLPARAPEFPGLDLACTCRMALEVGGDYIDFQVTPDHELAFALGDVSGKGVAAALLMSNLQAAWRSLSAVVERPGEWNRRLNDQLSATTSDAMFATFFQGAVRLDGDDLRLRYSNAGHNPPLLLRRGRLRALDKGGLILGAFRGMQYEEEELALESGDWLLLYTDGLSEALDATEEEFGEARVEAVLQAGGFATAEELIERLVAAVERFEDGAPRGDDLTLLVIHVLEDGDAA